MNSNNSQNGSIMTASQTMSLLMLLLLMLSLLP